jgi:hypothetical protein
VFARRYQHLNAGGKGPTSSGKGTRPRFMIVGVTVRGRGAASYVRVKAPAGDGLGRIESGLGDNNGGVSPCSCQGVLGTGRLALEWV